jgi:hypothetical protein
MMFLCLLTTAAFAENEDLQAKSRVDWESGQLILEMTVRLDLATALFPEARRAAERRAEDSRGGFFINAFFNVTLRSSQTVGEFFSDPNPGPERDRCLAGLNDLSRYGRKAVSVVSPDFQSLFVVYEYPFYGANGLVSPFVLHDRPLPLPAAPGYYVSRPFTGLVIYARGSYLAFGKNTQTPCAPALFPRLFYLSSRRTLEPVLDMSMVDPAVLKSRGMLAYARSADESAYAARAGTNPLTVSAFAVYGTNNTDLVIAEEAARMLLANEGNRALLRQGKIVVVID